MISCHTSYNTCHKESTQDNGSNALTLTWPSWSQTSWETMMSGSSTSKASGRSDLGRVMRTSLAGSKELRQRTRLFWSNKFLRVWLRLNTPLLYRMAKNLTLLRRELLSTMLTSSLQSTSRQLAKVSQTKRRMISWYNTYLSKKICSRQRKIRCTNFWHLQALLSTSWCSLPKGRALQSRLHQTPSQASVTMNTELVKYYTSSRLVQTSTHL